jgi:hypothetical protein
MVSILYIDCTGNSLTITCLCLLTAHTHLKSSDIVTLAKLLVAVFESDDLVSWLGGLFDLP